MSTTPEATAGATERKPTRRWTTGGALTVLSGTGVKMGRRATDLPTGEPGRPTNSLRMMLMNLVDYAGLFPPAGLGMKQAVENYVRYCAGDKAWMLGRFVVPATRLSELSDVLEKVKSDGRTWKATAILGDKLLGDLAMVAQFNQRNDGRMLIDAVEMKANNGEDIRRAREFVSRETSLFIEVPGADDPAEMLDAVKLANAHAKLRTGGVTPEAIPSAEVVARFLVQAATMKIAFKATAGLHHPVRCTRALTYDKGSPTGKMHGFINVFVGAAIARGGASEPEVAQVLRADSATQFSFADDGATVRALEGQQEYHVSTELFTETRRSFAISFGSCSFEEPVEELTAMQLL